MNSVCIIGRLARDPATRFEGEHQITTFTLAVEEKSREGTPWTLYVGCTAWGKSAEQASLVSAADLVSVQGRLSWNRQKAKCGQEHSQLVVSVRELVVLEPVCDTMTGPPTSAPVGWERRRATERR